MLGLPPSVRIYFATELTDVGGRLKTRKFGPEAGQRFFGLGGGGFGFARERSSA